MARKLLVRTDRFPYHVTSRSNNKEWFYVPTPIAWSIFQKSLAEAASRYGAEIHSLVLMSNHFHALISTPKLNIDDVMRYFVSLATFRIQRRSDRINHIFGARYNWSVLDSAYAVAYGLKYVYRNPVRARLVERVGEYPYSSLNDLSSTLPIVEGIGPLWSLVPKGPADREKWLNLPTPKEQEELIGLALRRTSFQFSTQTRFQGRLRRLRTSYGLAYPI